MSKTIPRKVHYCYGRHKGDISVWRAEGLPEKWYWAALGSDGQVVGDMWAAVAAAREWIINFYKIKETR